MNISISKALLVIVVCGVCLAGVELVAYSVKVLVLGVFSKFRKCKRDRRIIRQAKAAGVWDDPHIIGGRALELKAWQQYRLKRRPGETDACLRLRMWNAAKNEYADAPTNGGPKK